MHSPSKGEGLRDIEHSMSMVLDKRKCTFGSQQWHFNRKCDRCYYKMWQLFCCKMWQKFITKYVKFFITKYELLQTAAILLQIATNITKWDDYITKCDIITKSMILLQKVTVITKWDVYYKLRRSNCKFKHF